MPAGSWQTRDERTAVMQNHISSAPSAAGLGFKKSVAAFFSPVARVGVSRVTFVVDAKQNKVARTLQVSREHPS